MEGPDRTIRIGLCTGLRSSGQPTSAFDNSGVPDHVSHAENGSRSGSGGIGFRWGFRSLTARRVVVLPMSFLRPTGNDRLWHGSRQARRPHWSNLAGQYYVAALGRRKVEQRKNHHANSRDGSCVEVRACDKTILPRYA